MTETQLELVPVAEAFIGRGGVSVRYHQGLQELANTGAHIPRLPLYALEWQPIETAPKSTADGPQVHGIYLLGFCPDPDTCNLESAVCVIWWEPLMKGGKGMWYGEGGYEMHPTHWMPLPPLPAND